MVEEISKEEADKLLAEKYGFFDGKKFKGSMTEGRYIALHRGKYYSCRKLSEAAKVMGLIWR